MELDTTQARLLHKCDLLQAIVAFNYRYAECRASLDRWRTAIREIPGYKLNQTDIEFAIDAQLEMSRQEFGCRVTPEEVLEFFQIGSGTLTDVRTLSKYEIEAHYFSNFGGTFSGWEKLTPHHMIALDFSGEFSLPVLRWHLPEAALYEDMCIAANLAIETKDAYGKDQLRSKMNGFYIRTGILAAYYFVEAYLNGIAFDFMIRNITRMSQLDKDLLSEWDSKSNRRKWLSVERKVLDYQKIILSTKHPPITSTNSGHLKVLLGEGKEFRDSIVHNSPRYDPTTRVPEKLAAWSRIRLPHLLAIVDAAIGIVRDLNERFGKDGMDLTWLLDRKGDGTFPAQAFE